MSDIIAALPVKVSRTWKCGFCSGGSCQRCIGGIVNQGAVLVCSCKEHATMVRCVQCGNTQSEELVGWSCADPEACSSSLAARSAANPLRKELETVRMMGGEARRREMDRRTQAAIRAAVAESGIDEQLGLDVAADLDPDRPRKPRKPNGNGIPRATSGVCVCGCEGKTKGGRFLPGHDMKLKSALKKDIKAGNEEARAKMIEMGWEKFIPAA